MKPLDHLILVQGAGGQQLDYLGYVEATTEFPGLSLEQIPALFLVVPDTEYHTLVPVLIGTNVLGTSVFNTPIDSGLPSVWQLALRAECYFWQHRSGEDHQSSYCPRSW